MDDSDSFGGRRLQMMLWFRCTRQAGGSRLSSSVKFCLNCHFIISHLCFEITTLLSYIRTAIVLEFVRLADQRNVFIDLRVL